MKNLFILLVGVALLAGLFLFMKPEAVPTAPVAAATPATANGAGPTAFNSPPSAAADSAVPKLFELIVEKGRLASGPAVIQVQQGESLTLRITTDHDDELHLHGYDLTLPLHANQAAELQLLADRSGRFEYELHHAHSDLGALEVLPR